MNTNHQPLPTPTDAEPTDSESIDPQGLYLDEDTAVVLAEGVTSIISHMWRDEQRTYRSLPVDDRPGHVFEQLMRVKAIINHLRHDLSGGLPLLGCCPHCRGYDGNYAIDGFWWAFCQLCEVRWYVDELELSGTIWPVMRGRWAHELHNDYQPVEGDFGTSDAA